MSVKIQFRRDTSTNWASTNPTPAQGEPCFETDTNKWKIGDGTTAYNSLLYFVGGNVFDSISVDTINEKTSANGVIVDGVKFKDGGVRLEIDKHNLAMYNVGGTGSLSHNGIFEDGIWKFPVGVDNLTSTYNQANGAHKFYSNKTVGVDDFGDPILTIHPNGIVGDGTFLVTGTFGTSPALLESGAGTRCFFYPRKSAFRAGSADGTQWDDANIGFYSTAMGAGTTAFGSYSTAMGYGTTATGVYSLVGGRYMDDNSDSAFMWGRADASSSADYNIKTWRNSDTGTKYGTLKGTWDINGAAITSDIRLKENIKTIDSALDKINLINPVAFEWKRPEVRHEDDVVGEYGVIAQELEKVFPKLITHRPTEDPDLIPDGVQLGVKYNGLIAPMIKAIQELSAQNKELQNRIEILEKERN